MTKATLINVLRKCFVFFTTRLTLQCKFKPRCICNQRGRTKCNSSTAPFWYL